MLFDISEHTDLNKTRRSVIWCSIVTLLISNASLTNSEIEFFGLSLEVDQKKIVALGQIAVTILTVIFSIHVAEALASWLKQKYKKLSEIWEKSAREEIDQIMAEAEGWHEGHRNGFDDLDPWDQQYWVEKQRRHKNQEKIDLFFEVVTNFKQIFLNFIFSYALALTTIFAPQFLGDFIQMYLPETETARAVFCDEVFLP